MSKYWFQRNKDRRRRNRVTRTPKDVLYYRNEFRIRVLTSHNLRCRRRQMKWLYKEYGKGIQRLMNSKWKANNNLFWLRSDDYLHRLDMDRTYWGLLQLRCRNCAITINDLKRYSGGERDCEKLEEFLKGLFRYTDAHAQHGVVISRLFNSCWRDFKNEYKAIINSSPALAGAMRCWVLIKQVSSQIRKGKFKPQKKEQVKAMDIKIRTDQDLRDASAYVLEGLLNGTVPYRIANAFSSVQRNIVMMNAQRILAQRHNGVQTIKIPALCSSRVQHEKEEGTKLVKVG